MSASDFVTLTGGLVVPLEALQLALNLETRGCSLRVEAETLLAGPGNRLTDADRRDIRRWRTQLIAIARYQVETVQ